MVFEQANFTRSKTASPLVIAGVDVQGPILAGFSGRFTLSFRNEETLVSWRIYSENGFENILVNNQSAPGEDATADVTFGSGTDTGSQPVRNFIEWVTDRITQTRQFFVQNLPSFQSLYINNEDAQSGEAVIFFNPLDSQRTARDASFSINILPNFSDEFFNLQEWRGGSQVSGEELLLLEPNRWANTRRAWGGAKTAEVFLDGSQIIVELPIEDIHGFYWRAPTIGSHNIRVRIRANKGSGSFIDIDGIIRARQIQCKVVEE